jgi:uncharacterized membrane protein
VSLSAFEWLSIFLIGVGLVLPSILATVFVARNKISDPKVYLALLIATLFSFAVVATFGIIIGVGLKRLVLETTMFNWLGAATIGEIAGMLYIIIKAYFGKSSRE